MADKPKQRNDRDVTAYRAFTGIRNDIGPERFDPTDLAVADNVNIDKSGRISRRDGYTQRVPQPAHSLWAKGDLALFVTGTQLLRLLPDYSVAPLRDVTDARMSYCKVNDRIYFSNGGDTGVIDAGVARAWGLPVPPLPTATATTGTLAAGAYQYTVTYLRADGQESGAAQAGVITLDGNSTILFAVPDPVDPEIVGKNVYLTPPNGDVLYLAQTLARGDTAYLVSEADVHGLTLPLLTQFMQAAPAGQLITYYKGRVFVASGDTLYPSEPLAYELFDLRNYVQVDGQITLLAPLEDKDGNQSGLFVGTDRSCGILVGTGPENFQYVPKVDYGAVFGAVDYVEGALFSDNSIGSRMLPMWLSTQGICVGLPDMTIQNLTRTKYSTSMSGPGAALFIPGNNRFIAVQNNAPTYAMHTETMSLWTYSNFQFNSFAKFNGAFLAASDNGVFELTGDKDDTADIDAVVRLGTSDFGTSFTKKIDRVYAGYRCAGELALRVTADETQTYEYALPALGSGIQGARVKLGRGLSARYWQFEVRNVGGVDFDLDVLDVQPLINQRRVTHGTA